MLKAMLSTKRRSHESPKKTRRIRAAVEPRSKEGRMSDHTRNQSAGVDQVEVTRRTLRQSGLNEQVEAEKDQQK
jgi:hypothetical protein